MFKEFIGKITGATAKMNKKGEEMMTEDQERMSKERGYYSKLKKELKFNGNIDTVKGGKNAGDLLFSGTVNGEEFTGSYHRTSNGSFDPSIKNSEVTVNGKPLSARAAQLFVQKYEPIIYERAGNVWSEERAGSFEDMQKRQEEKDEEKKEMQDAIKERKDADENAKKELRDELGL